MLIIICDNNKLKHQLDETFSLLKDLNIKSERRDDGYYVYFSAPLDYCVIKTKDTSISICNSQCISAVELDPPHSPDSIRLVNINDKLQDFIENFLKNRGQ